MSRFARSPTNLAITYWECLNGSHVFSVLPRSQNKLNESIASQLSLTFKKSFLLVYKNLVSNMHTRIFFFCVCVCVCVCRAKHPVKVHVWAGISLRGSTGICIFSGIMKAPLYIQIIERSLLSFLHDAFPDGQRFIQDNDPKHTSMLARAFFEDNGVHWWKTPA